MAMTKRKKQIEKMKKQLLKDVNVSVKKKSKKREVNYGEYENMYRNLLLTIQLFKKSTKKSHARISYNNHLKSSGMHGIESLILFTLKYKIENKFNNWLVKNKTSTEEEKLLKKTEIQKQISGDFENMISSISKSRTTSLKKFFERIEKDICEYDNLIDIKKKKIFVYDHRKNVGKASEKRRKNVGKTSEKQKPKKKKVLDRKQPPKKKKKINKTSTPKKSTSKKNTPKKSTSKKRPKKK